MAQKNRHKHVLVIIEVVAASMILECQLADKLNEIGNDPEEDISPFESVARPSDYAGLDPS